MKIFKLIKRIQSKLTKIQFFKNNYDFFFNFRFILWRKANKVAINLSLTPDGKLMSGDEVKVGFTMHFTYSTVHASSSSTPEKVLLKDSQQRHALSARVYFNAGIVA